LKGKGYCGIPAFSLYLCQFYFVLNTVRTHPTVMVASDREQGRYFPGYPYLRKFERKVERWISYIFLDTKKTKCSQIKYPVHC
jgi:hypothetical protein